MSWAPPLLVAIPLLTAAVVAGGDHLLPRRVQDALAILAAAAVCCLGIALMVASEHREVVHWFGGWRPSPRSSGASCSSGSSTPGRT